MKQCPYMARLVVARSVRETPTQVIYARCQRRAILGSPGWHLHAAPMPKRLFRAANGVRIRWRSTNTPDYHVDHTDTRQPVEGGA